MDFDELSTCSFQVTDSLDAGCRERLATACQRLDLPVARASLLPEEFRKVDDARRQALSAALASTWALVDESRFDLQVLTVLMRLLVEVEGLSGIDRALRVIHRMIVDGWGERETALASLEPKDRERVLRQWTRYFDAVFEQIDAYVARESDLHGEAFAVELRTRSASLVEVCELVEAAWSRGNWRSTWWPRLYRSLNDHWQAALRPEFRAMPPGDAPSGLGEVNRAAEASKCKSVQTKHSNESVPVELSSVAHTSVDSDVREEATTGVASSAEGTHSEVLTADSNVATLRVSERFWVLQRSLGALETLLKSGEYEKARVIVREIEELLQAFDVPSYFPGLFGSFFELSARYSEVLNSHYQRSPQREAALSRLYRSDLGRFLTVTLGEDA
jgi:hypothetical protein